MKILAYILLVVFAVTGCSKAPEKKEHQEPVSSNPAIPATLPGVKSTSLSDAEISSLKTEWSDEKTGSKIVFESEFKSLKGSGKKPGTIPFKITAQLVESKKAGNRILEKRLPGTLHISISDPDGKTLMNESVSLDKMCPS